MKTFWWFNDPIFSWLYLHRLGRGSLLGSSLSRSDLGKISLIISSQVWSIFRKSRLMVMPMMMVMTMIMMISQIIPRYDVSWVSSAWWRAVVRHGWKWPKITFSFPSFSFHLSIWNARSIHNYPSLQCWGNCFNFHFTCVIHSCVFILSYLWVGLSYLGQPCLRMKMWDFLWLPFFTMSFTGNANMSISKQLWSFISAIINVCLLSFSQGI